jgi:nucleoside-diphosphate-sugar epimerase
MNIVVTGGAGYVGSLVSAHLLVAGHGVTVLDSLAGGGEALLGFLSHARCRLVVGDVRDRALVATAISGADAVVHFAAVVGESACAVDPVNARSINCDGTVTALLAAAAVGVARFVMVSTCSNYGVTDSGVLADEDAPLRPLGVYASSKVEAEEAVLRSGPAISRTVLRLGTICGLSPRMRFDLLVNDMARAAALDDPIRLFAPDAWRPFLHIRDAARAVEWALEAAKPAAARVFNVVGDNYQKKGLLELVRRHFPEAVIEVQPAVPDARDYRVSAARIRQEGGFAPACTIEAAFLETAYAVRSGAFRNPRWSGHAAAPAPASFPRGAPAPPWMSR